MREFLDVLKKTYMLCGAIAIFIAFSIGPVALAINTENVWWAILEIITAPIGVAAAAFVMTKLDNL